MNIKNLCRSVVTSLLIGAFVLCATAQTSNRYGGSYAKGVKLFYAEDYAGAGDEFEKALAENPANHAAYLWQGLVFTAMGELDGRASNIWLKMPYDEKWKSTFRYFMGLGYWQQGSTNSAKYWFKETMNHPEVPAAGLAQTALKSLLDDGEAPPIQVWATLARLPGAKTEKDFAGEDEPDETSSDSSQNSKPVAPAKRTAASANNSSGAKPAGGLWKALISNGYKGQTLSFRVSADGKTIFDITFKGYLQCRGSRIEDTQLAPLKNVTISGGSFEDTQLNGGAKVRFDFSGTFASASSASGTYRVMSDTDCDTYKLNWTATRVGQ